MTAQVQSVLDADQHRLDALLAADATALEAVLSDHLVLIHTNGSLDSKSTLLAKVASRKILYKTLAHLESAVTLLGDVGIQTSTTHIVVEVNGLAKEFRCRSTAVWVLTDGRWLMRQYQTTTVA